MKPLDEALHDAVIIGDIHAAKLLIEDGADVNAKDSNGMTVLHVITDDCVEEHCDVEAMINLLLDNGADVNALASEDYTPLHLAVTYHDRVVWASLIHRGANVTARDDDGRMPIHIPLECGRIGDVRFLAQYYDESVIDVFVASMIGRHERVREILDDDPTQANTVDDYGSTPLMEAVFHDQLPVVKLLLDRGALPNTQNQGGITALHLATNPEIFELLLAHGADPTIRDVKGATPPIP